MLESHKGLFVSGNVQTICPVPRAVVDIGFMSALRYGPAVSAWIALARLLVSIQTRSFKQTGIRHRLSKAIAYLTLLGTGRLQTTDVS